jgi:hypothetical protein
MSRYAPNLVLSLGSMLGVIACALGIELLLRRHDPEYLVRARGLHVYSETYGWQPRKGISTTYRGERITLNAHGQRGREIERARQESDRLVLLGDSIAFGSGVSDDETFAHRLDVRDGLEVVNLAVQGYGPSQQLLKLDREGLRQRPSAVLLSFCFDNDFADAVSPTFIYNGRVPTPYFSLDGRRLKLHAEHLRLRPLERWGTWLLDRSHGFHRLVALADHNAATARAALLDHPPLDGVSWGERKRRALGNGDYASRLAFELIRAMSQRCRERQIPFAVALFPNRRAYEREQEAAQYARFRGRHRDAGLMCIDMAERFKAAGLGFWDFAADGIGHLSPRGHLIAAEILEEELLRMGVGARRDAARRVASR